jgi:N-methylhydantoinase A/oxoprolinase/acetone carboxylase beta subunit
VIDQFWVDMTILQTTSIGAGGGSIARVNHTVGDRLEVGPRGAGSMPGPACYGLGGKEPTVTDADIVLGVIADGTTFSGGLALKRSLAERAIATHIAEPLGISVIEAAQRIRRTVDANMADAITRETLLRGYDPHDFTLLAFGGAGPMHCTGFGGQLGVRSTYVLPMSPVFCAWGSSTMPVAHIYEASRRVELIAPLSQNPLLDFPQFNDVVDELRERALRDLEGEGYDISAATFSLELDMKFGGQLHLHRASSPVLKLNDVADVERVYEDFADGYAAVFSPINVYPRGGVEIHNFVLRAQMPVPEWDLPSYPLEGPDPSAARISQREVHWIQGSQQTDIYSQALLRPGNRATGPLIVEADFTTVAVEPGFDLFVDEYLNYVITESGQ